MTVWIRDSDLEEFEEYRQGDVGMLEPLFSELTTAEDRTRGPGTREPGAATSDRVVSFCFAISLSSRRASLLAGVLKTKAA